MERISRIKLSFLVIVFTITKAINFPVSFTVVRNISPPIGIDSFLTKTGCCQSDSYGNSVGYSIMSLDGFKSTSYLSALNSQVSPMSVWMNAFSQISASNPGKGGSSTAEVQKYILQTYHSKGALLLMNALSDQAPISHKNMSAQSVAQNIISVIQAAQLDGVSIQFGDYQAVAQGTASAWLQTLLLGLRTALPDKIIVLIIPVSIINRVPLLQQSQVSALADLFVLKYYGFNQPDYTDYNSLFKTSKVIAQTAFSQLLKSKAVGIDLCRTLISKPVTSNIDSFMSEVSLGVAFESAYSEFAWFGGFANLDFEADPKGSFQYTVLRQLRNRCFAQGKCICQ